MSGGEAGQRAPPAWASCKILNERFNIMTFRDNYYYGDSANSVIPSLCQRAAILRPQTDNKNKCPLAVPRTRDTILFVVGVGGVAAARAGGGSRGRAGEGGAARKVTWWGGRPPGLRGRADPPRGDASRPCT